jgi:riboflavin transporter FmnP
MSFQKNLGLLLTGVYLILVGLTPFLKLDLGVVPAIIAIIAGVLLVLAR